MLPTVVAAEAVERNSAAGKRRIEIEATASSELVQN